MAAIHRSISDSGLVPNGQVVDGLLGEILKDHFFFILRLSISAGKKPQLIWLKLLMSNSVT
jgi:hypothetical protein